MTQDAQKFTEEDLHKSAQLWCLPQHAHKEIDTEFAKSIAQVLRDERKGLEDRLSEAVRVIEYYAEDIKDGTHTLARDFLSSPTNSEAQERQRAKDEVIEVARNAHSYKGKLLHDRCNTCRALQALDSLCDKKTGGESC